MPKKNRLDQPTSPPTLSTRNELLTAGTISDPAASAMRRLNEKELADRWGVSVRTLQAARVKGSGVPFVRIGRAVRYRLEDVLAYEQGRLRTSTSESC